MLTCGTKDDNKYKILNSVLVKFFQVHVMNRAASEMNKKDKYAYDYKSTLWDTMLKTIFSELHKHHVIFNCPGYFVDVQDNKLKLIAKVHSDFGALPNCGEVDLAAHDKVASVVEDGRLKLDKDWLHLIWLLHWFISCYFMMRRGLEM